ncbi:MAG: beta-lactamase family protein [Algicola sp.]|nr:beta-lactamase family protein [Algicola sp.]
MLGLVLEKITAKPLAQLLNELIFSKAGMNSTHLQTDMSIIKGMVPSYRYNFVKARYDNAEFRHPSTTFATGGIISNINDLLKWDRVLYTNKLLSQPDRDRLFDVQQGKAAFGWRNGHMDNKNTQIVWHGGLVTGYRAQITRVLDKQQVVILLTNQRDTNANGITHEILSILAGDETTTVKRSLMKEVLWYSAHKGSEAAIKRFDQIVKNEQDTFDVVDTELLVAALELKNDGVCVRAKPLFAHWIASYPKSEYAQYALDGLKGCP